MTQTGEVIQVSENMVEYLNEYLGLFPKYSIVKKVILFGSTLEERCTDESDIDFYIVYAGTDRMFIKFLTDLYLDFTEVAWDDFLCCTVEEYPLKLQSGLLHSIMEKGAKIIYESD